MYLWKVDSLVSDFKTGKVSQFEEFKYILLFTILTTLVSDPFLYIGSSYNQYDAISTFLILGITISGVYYCYQINKKGDNKEFIVRVMCIGLPAGIRVLSVFLPLLIIAGVLEVVFLEDANKLEAGTVENTPLQVIMMAAFIATYYFYLSKKIHDVSVQNA